MGESKEKIINRLISNNAEIITATELQERLKSESQLTHYIGFEISGYVHLGTGIMSALVMKDLTDLGVKCTVWLADWHSAINNKLDGTRETAATIGRGYFTEAMKASYVAVGGNPEDIEFRLASEWYNKDPESYWGTVIKVGQHTTLARMLRSIDITGKEAGEDVDYARTMYPAMQAADVFFQNIDIAHAGMDQRKIHVVVRDAASKIAPDKPKPIIIHHPLLQSLNGKNKEDKMSKSNPDSAIFVHDDPKDIEHKIKKAFAPEKEIDHNPILNWTKTMLFWNRSKPFVIERKEEHGGNLEFTSYAELEKTYATGNLHPMDLKNTVAHELIQLLAPVREHMAKPEIAAMKADLDAVLAAKK
ncbi:MAG: tyrosine--tRNA ligase [Candidatus Andersenbacteria bacterium]|nr:tyrosine--tRNA ligase [Candidatus Andersenbacteria bacterium]MBI3250497.1 tyrosine--tRNA ligase [Candidatus Andersenbacteria bacterium]